MKLSVVLMSILISIFAIFGIFYAIDFISIANKPVYAKSEIIQPKYELTETSFAFPKQGSGAIGLINGNEVSCKTYGVDELHPTASVAKVITALVILDKINNDTNNFIIVSEDDVKMYNQMLAVGGSNLPVIQGDKLTYYQLLQGIMISSSDNMADSLAIEVFGSLENYKIAAENWLQESGLKKTKIGADASGLDHETASTPSELCEITALALKNTTLTEIMGMKTVENFPNVGVIENTNQILGQEGIFAGKTGYIHESGRNLVTAAKIGENTIITVVLGQSSRESVFAATLDLIKSADKNIISRKIEKGQIIATAKSPADDKSVNFIATESLTFPTWKDEAVEFKFESESEKETLMPIEINKTSKTLLIPGDRKLKLIADESLKTPNFIWRIMNSERLNLNTKP